MLKKKAYTFDKTAMLRSIITFAWRTGCVIHPYLGAGQFITNYRALNCCACDPKRHHCPCAEAKAEVETVGKCYCGLFWKSLQHYMVYDPLHPEITPNQAVAIVNDPEIGEKHGNTGTEPDRGL